MAWPIGGTPDDHQSVQDVVAALRTAPPAHQHQVTDITATGTRSSTTALFGDGSWKVPTSTGSVGSATETTAGIVRLATTAETTTGTDATAAVTPAALAAVASAKANVLSTQTTQTGGTYTFTLADSGTLVEGNSATAQTFTVPPESTAAFSIGASMVIRQYGAGQITLAPGAGVTLRSRGGALKLAGQYAEATLTKRAANEWITSGDLST